jgi:hypothetical protein
MSAQKSYMDVTRETLLDQRYWAGLIKSSYYLLAPSRAGCQEVAA